MALKSFVPALYLLAAAGFYLCMAQAQPQTSAVKVWPVDALLHPPHTPKLAPRQAGASDPTRLGVPRHSEQQSVRNTAATGSQPA